MNKFDFIHGSPMLKASYGITLDLNSFRGIAGLCGCTDTPWRSCADTLALFREHSLVSCSNFQPIISSPTGIGTTRLMLALTYITPQFSRPTQR